MTDGTYTILVTGDDQRARAAVVALLATSGCGITVADSAVEARTLVGESTVDLLVMAMAEGPSPETRALAADAGARGIPVLGVASAADLPHAATALGAHAGGWLLSPVDPTALGVRLETYRRHRQLGVDVARLRHRQDELERSCDAFLKAVIPIGVSLLVARDFLRMLETILGEAKTLCHADGGTLYLRTGDEHLRFVIVHNDSLGIAMGGASGVEVPFPPLPLVDPASGRPNESNVATYAALTGRSVNIADAYQARGFEFSGTRAFDQRSGYRSCSFLTVPLKNQEDRVIGVLQLLNALDPATGAVIPFAASLEPVVEALCTLAAAALEVYQREEGLRQQIRDLHIQIDEAKRARQVTAIADSDYFRELQQQARELKRT